MVDRLVDWRMIGIEFRRKGWTTAAIARELNVPWSTVKNWFGPDGKDPRRLNAERCLELYHRVCKTHLDP